MARSPWYLLCLSLAVLQSLCQDPELIEYKPYQRLPDLDPAISNGGNFAFPAGPTQIYDHGSPMTVRWNTTFAAVNLYLLQNASMDPAGVGKQLQLRLSYTQNFFDWTVERHVNCRAPFELKIVDAFGDSQATFGGGFYSRPFWIRERITSSSAQVSSSSTSLSSASPASSSSVSVTGSSTSTIGGPTASPATTTVTPTPEPAPASDSKTTTIGAAVGAGLGAVLLSVLLFFLWRRRSKRKQIYGHGSTMSLDGTYSQQPYYAYKTESYYQTPSELPDHRSEPQELADRTPEMPSQRFPKQGHD
ncbi:Hypothetical protein D9617_16g014550 [Elsinoe fawcettii]|nr:Hypothetical protein D9617_16g014550 [Elsinoe fawcettii]